MTQIRLPSEKHAIKTMAFILELAPKLEGPAFRAANSALSGPLKEQLPKQHEKKSFNIEFEVGESAQQRLVEHEIAGLTFSRVKPDGTNQLALNFSAGSISVECGEYDTWQKKAEEAVGLLLQGVSAIKDFTAPSSIAIRYIDEFYWDGDFSAVVLSEVLNEKSAFFAQNVFEARSLFHSHHGFFQDAQLVNLNVELSQRNDKCTLRVISVHKEPFKVDGAAFEVEVKNRFNSLHDANKKLLKNVLSDKMCLRINL